MQGVKAFNSHTDWITSIAWSPLSEYQVLTSSHDKSVKLWDTRAAVPLHTLEGHTDKVCYKACGYAVQVLTYNLGHNKHIASCMDLLFRCISQFGVGCYCRYSAQGGVSKSVQPPGELTAN